MYKLLENYFDNFVALVFFNLDSIVIWQIYKPNWIRPPKKEDDKEDEVKDFPQKEKRKIKEVDDSLGIVYKGKIIKLWFPKFSIKNAY